jgi:hypothetical protein
VIAILLIGGALWNLCPTGAIILSLLLPAIITQTGKKSAQWALAFLWFFAGSISVIPATVGFFGSQALPLGLIMCFISSALLALPWVIASTPVMAVMAVLLDAIPPIGLIGWLSPLAAAGWLFPGQGLAGLVGCLLVMIWIAVMSKQPTNSYSVYITGGILFAWILIANVTYIQPATPTGWIGIQTSVLPDNGNVFQTITNNRSVIEAAQTQNKHHGTFLLFPEAILGDWWTGTRTQFASAVPLGQTWFIGAATKEGGAHWDALVIARAHSTVSNGFSRAALPMPVSMWRPGFHEGFAASWHESAQKIGNNRVWANFCFDQVLPWVWIDGMLQHPDLVLLPSNSWWAQPWNPAPEIQRAEALAWIRLMGVPAILANNRNKSLSFR